MAKILKGIYTNLTWNFQRGGGFKPKKPSVGGVWIFSVTTHSIHLMYTCRCRAPLDTSLQAFSLYESEWRTFM